MSYIANQASYTNSSWTARPTITVEPLLTNIPELQTDTCYMIDTDVQIESLYIRNP